jgi:hypothetical protein
MLQNCVYCRSWLKPERCSALDVCRRLFSYVHLASVFHAEWGLEQHSVIRFLSVLMTFSSERPTQTWTQLNCYRSNTQHERFHLAWTALRNIASLLCDCQNCFAVTQATLWPWFWEGKTSVAKMSICMYVCMYIYICVCVCVRVCVYACMYVCMHICMCVCIYIRVYVCVCVCMYVRTCVYVRWMMCVCIPVYILHVHSHLYTQRAVIFHEIFAECAKWTHTYVVFIPETTGWIHIKLCYWMYSWTLFWTDVILTCLK